MNQQIYNHITGHYRRYVTGAIGQVAKRVGSLMSKPHGRYIFTFDINTMVGSVGLRVLDLQGDGIEIVEKIDIRNVDVIFADGLTNEPRPFEDVDQRMATFRETITRMRATLTKYSALNRKSRKEQSKKLAH